MPRTAKNADAKIAHEFFAILGAKADQSGWLAVRHMPRKFQRIPFRATENAAICREKCGNRVNYAGHSVSMLLQRSSYGEMKKGDPKVPHPTDRNVDESCYLSDFEAAPAEARVPMEAGRLVAVSNLTRRRPGSPAISIEVRL
jgi:hypothetical protein